MEELIDQIFAEIKAEREYQNKLWGTEFDDKNTINDWSAYITRYLGQATGSENEAEQRTQMMKVASLAVAALEAINRNGKFAPRHYDGTIA